ncbi:MAG: Csu type fimbrial protein [Gammaproteobacteria bacterium]
MNNVLVQLQTFPRPCGQRSRRKKSWVLALGGFGLLLISGFACAAPNCTISSTAVSFGNYDPLSSTALTSTGTLTFNCTSGVPGGGVPFTISLNPGNSGTYSMRTLKSGSNTLNYNLYTDASDTTVWGDGSPGTGTVTGNYPKNSPPVNALVYAFLPALQDAVPGSYSDSITATVTF